MEEGEKPVFVSMGRFSLGKNWGKMRKNGFFEIFLLI